MEHLLHRYNYIISLFNTLIYNFSAVFSLSIGSQWLPMIARRNEKYGEKSIWFDNNCIIELFANHEILKCTNTMH